LGFLIIGATTTLLIIILIRFRRRLKSKTKFN
jgi:hypothetical protein